MPVVLKSPKPCLSESSTHSATKAMSCSTPFCGCGTAVAAAERLNRRWIGIDITHLAITLIGHRMYDSFGEDLKPYEVVGEPKDLFSAESLAIQDRYQFEWWALGLVDARPARDRKKGADAGIDGYITFFDDNSGKPKRIVVQVKSGHVQRNQIATLKSDMEREKADLALFVTLSHAQNLCGRKPTERVSMPPKHFLATITRRCRSSPSTSCWPVGALNTLATRQRRHSSERLGVEAKPARDGLHSLWRLRTQLAAGPTRAAYSKQRGVVPDSIHTCCKPFLDRCLQTGQRLTELSRCANYELGPTMQAFTAFSCIANPRIRKPCSHRRSKL